MQPRGEQPSFGSLLRRYRTRAGLTQEQLAEHAGLSRRGIADLERGARQAPYAHTLDQLRTALGLSDADDALLLSTARAARASAPEPLLEARQSADGAPVTAQRRPEDGQQRTNLPIQPTSFVGRKMERSHLAALIPSAPLVTLVGPGGVGKTRLALEVAAETNELWPDGVWLVEFAPLIDSNDAHIVHASVAAVLGVRQVSGLDAASSLILWLRSKRMLLVFDNCEHVVEPCAHLVSQIVQTCSDVHVLATSREPLGIQGETVSRVDPLAVPSDACTPDTALQSEAVQLFVDRASAAAPRFRLTEHNAAAVASICGRLDGIPLALELAAPRLRSLSVENVVELLDKRFELLTTGNRDALPRHRTLRALVDWSFQLLNDAERTFFIQLSTFTGGWTLDAADAICGSGSSLTVDFLGQLVDKSLIQAEPQADGSIRYGMLETLRQYAVEQLLRTGHADEVHRQHALFFADAIEGRWGRFWIGENTRIRMASVERDYENFRASLRWLLDHEEMEAVARLAAELTAFWSLGGRVQEGRDWQEQILAKSRSADEVSPWRLRLAFGLAQLEAVIGNRAAAYQRLEKILPALRASDDAPTLAQALGLAASLTWFLRHDLPAARDLAHEAVRVAQTTGIGPLEMLELGRLAGILVESGEYDAAEQLLTDDATTDSWNAPRATIDLARVYFGKQNYGAAAALLNELVFGFDPNRSRLEVVLACTVLSWVRLADGDVTGAAGAATQAVMLVRENLGRSTSSGHLPGPLEALAMVAAADHRPTRALRLAAAAASLRDAHDEGLSPNDRARLECWLEVARHALGPLASAEAWAVGQVLDSDAAIREALAIEAVPGVMSFPRIGP